jgi:uncharacterized DUF497 family protein
MAYTMLVRFEWDPAKDEANQRKHGVSFDDACELLSGGTDYLELFDEVHSDVEERFIAIGPTRRGILLVVYTERFEKTIRIISARWATPEERRLYCRYMEQDR